MIRATTLLLFVAAAGWSSSATVWYSDGTGIEIQTRSTGPTTPVSSGGTEAVAEGYPFHRLVFGKDAILLGYDIEARKNAQGAFTIRVKPVNKDQIRVGGYGEWQEIPTLSNVREFPPLRPGDAIEVDILYNATTRERIYDVLKVLPPRAPRGVVQVANDKLSFKHVGILADGKTIGGSQTAWMICGGMKIHLPHRGTFYLTLNPPPDYEFKPAAWVDHKVLRIHAGSELIEIFGETNVLQRSDFGTIWVYHIADGPDAARTEELGFYCVDSIDQALPPK